MKVRRLSERMTTTHGPILNGLFIFYVIVAANCITTMLSCDLQRILNDNMWVKNAIAFMTIYFSVILVNTTDDNEKQPMKLLMSTLLLYALFLVTTHCNFRYFVAAVVCMFVIYISHDFKKSLEQLSARVTDDSSGAKQKGKQLIDLVVKIINYVQIYAQVIIVGIFCVGFVVNLGEQSLKNKGSWNWTKYFLDIPCRETNTGAMGKELYKKYHNSGLFIAGLRRMFLQR